MALPYVAVYLAAMTNTDAIFRTVPLQNYHVFWKDLPCKHVNKHWRFGAAQHLQLALQICPQNILETNTSVQAERFGKMCCWTGPKPESLLSLLHCSLFVIRSRRTHSLQCYTALNQFSLKRVSHCYNSTVIAPTTLYIRNSPVWPKVFLPAQQCYQNMYITYSYNIYFTVRQTLQSAAHWLSYTEKTVRHIYCI